MPYFTYWIFVSLDLLLREIQARKATLLDGRDLGVIPGYCRPSRNFPTVDNGNTDQLITTLLPIKIYSLAAIWAGERMLGGREACLPV